MSLELRRYHGTGELLEGASRNAPAMQAIAPILSNRKGVYGPDTDLQSYYHRELNSLSSISHSLVEQSYEGSINISTALHYNRFLKELL